MGQLIKTVQQLNDILKFQKGIPTGGDAGIHFTSPDLKNIIIGDSDNPVELCIGQGDSTNDSMVAYHSSDDVNFTDITSDLIVGDGSVVGLFGGTASGLRVYVGADWRFSGTKVAVESAGGGLHGKFLSQYWSQGAWHNVSVMAVNSSYDIFSEFNQRADNIASVSGISEQWYFDLDPYSEHPVWEKTTINGVEKYWARMILIGAITTDPQIDQIKCHVNRVEIENVGIFRYGAARYPKILNNGLSSIVQNADATPRDESVAYSTDMTAGYLHNELQNGFNDGFLFVQNIEQGMDTSTKLKLSVAYYVKGSATGNIKLSADVVLVGQDVRLGGPFLYDGNAPFDPYPMEANVTSDQDLIRRVAHCYIDITHLTPHDAMVINIHRDGAHAEDTLNASIVMTHIVPIAYFWKD